MAGAWQIRVRGLVQGVGFRPFVWRLANAADLHGEVLNDAQGVIIRLAATSAQLAAFQAEMRGEIPPLARIDAIEVTKIDDAPKWFGFAIVASRKGRISTAIVPDAATCADCLADITDPQNRRYGYAFTNCTNCGPRLSITRAIPYDRANTAMVAFEMCAACQAEYDDPSDRRFHAQPNACADCGPHLNLVDRQGSVAGDPITEVARALKAGKIVAIKGLGGFQLAVDAGNSQAVERLRARKRRPTKPLACMAQDLAVVARFADLNDAAAQVLVSPQAPIVLVKIAGAPLADGLAPAQNRLGFMLPNTPLHHLLMRQLEHPIVLTSGNLSDEPQVTDNAVALKMLAEIADLWLLHDREIINRLDDSVVQTIGEAPQILRRSRGYAPAPLRLHPGFGDAPAILATGADLKNTFCLLKDGQAIVSQHMGDMEDPETQRDFSANLELYRRIYDFNPSCIATDMHPGYFSTRLGQQIAAQEGIDTLPVQHHHAHIAAVLAEHGFGPDTGPVLGVVLDGMGQGSDGNIWGGEFSLVDFHGFERLAYFQPVALPGGDKANRQPWRSLFAHLHAALGPEVIKDYAALPVILTLSRKPLPLLEKMIDQGLNSPRASSAGRLFDAVAAALGLSFERVSYEGEAAIQLQVLAESCPWEDGFYHIPATEILRWQTLWTGILDDLRQGVAPEIIAKRFHNSLIRVICESILSLARQHGINTVVLTGGVFQNALLASGVTSALRMHSLNVLSAKNFPANDGGISLGQACVVACKAQSRSRLAENARPQFRPLRHRCPFRVPIQNPA